MKNESTPPSLQRLSEEQKIIIKKNQNPDASIIAEYSAYGYEITSEIIARIKGQATPFITAPNNIKELSENANLDPRNHVCDEPNITPHAVVAVVTDGDGNIKSSLISGTKTPDPDSGSIDKDTSIAVGSVTKMFTSAALPKLWDNELTDENIGEPGGKAKNFPKGIDTPLSHFMDGLKEKFPGCTYLESIEKTKHYPQVTLRDLLNHTHALGSRDE